MKRAHEESANGTELRERMLRSNSLLAAWRLNYIANFFSVPFYLALDQRLGISRGEYVILFCVAQHPGITAQDIVLASGRPKNSISVAVGKLERKRMITRKRNNDDARRMELRATASGLSVYRKVMPLLKARERRMFAPLTPVQRKQFDALLLKIADRVAEWQDPDLGSLVRDRRSG
jgi:DNA-binding MarR family transcriptional regulator